MRLKSKVTPSALTTAVVILFIAGMFFRFLYHIIILSDGYTDFLTDDFYYYFITAKNFVAHGISSFDGITHTNGYHPLWMLCISALYAVSFGNDGVFFVYLALVSSISTYLTYRYLKNLYETLFPASAFGNIPLLFVIVIYAGMLFLGMEITLTVPLIAYMLSKIAATDFTKNISSRQALLFGILSSLVILSRLDTVIFIAVVALFSFSLSGGTMKEKIKPLVFLLVGLIPVCIYFLINYYYFGHFLTVSSAIKSLKASGAISFDLLKYIALNRDGMFGLLLIPISFIILFFSKRKRPVQHIAVISAILFFPIIYYLILLYKSDWFLNRWYLFPLPIVFLISFGLITEIIENAVKRKRILFYGSNIVLYCTIIYVLFFGVSLVIRDTIRWQAHPNSVYTQAKQLLGFTKDHPGLYAMGDRAGLTAYLIDKPTLQLEGLIADYRMYEHIKHQDDLASVLREYNVKYLIETADKNGLPHTGNIYEIEEPHTGQAGNLSPKMKGRIEGPPVFIAETSNDEGFKVISYIFEVGKER
jgi:hypothetical protein